MYTINRNSKGGADVTAAAAAALAATYEVFKTSDPTYATSALTHSQELYALATNLPVNATYCAEVACFEGLKSGGYRWKAYLSDSVYDDLALAASWLYKATGEGKLVQRYLKSSFDVECYTFYMQVAAETLAGTWYHTTSSS